MSTEVISVYVLTVLAGIVVVLTRLRLRGDGPGAGRAAIARAPLAVHTGAGALALVLWVVFLVGGDAFSEDAATMLGFSGLVLWWVVALAGLLILVRWLPTRGRHAAPGDSDSWSDGPGLSVLAHVGMVVGVLVFTWAFMLSKV